jgi:hypothetical protein
LPKQSSNATENNGLDPKDKELFLKTWDLKEGEMTNLQILMAIKNGQLYESVNWFELRWCHHGHNHSHNEDAKRSKY